MPACTQSRDAGARDVAIGVLDADDHPGHAGVDDRVAHMVPCGPGGSRARASCTGWRPGCRPDRPQQQPRRGRRSRHGGRPGGSVAPVNDAPSAVTSTAPTHGLGDVTARTPAAACTASAILASSCSATSRHPNGRARRGTRVPRSHPDSRPASLRTEHRRPRGSTGSAPRHWARGSRALTAGSDSHQLLHPARECVPRKCRTGSTRRSQCRAEAGSSGQCG